METLEICTDASIRDFENGRQFGCSGAYCINNREQDYLISPDTTNNRSEMLAVYIGIKLAEKIMQYYPNKYDKIYIYSDSQFTVYGIKKWMDSWIATAGPTGTLFGTNGKPVKNQELFKAIITYCTTHNLHVNLFHQKGHVRLNSPKSLDQANKVFYTSNGFWLRPEDIYKISYYNDLIDKSTRQKLYEVRESDYPKMDYSENHLTMCSYVIPLNYKQFIQ
jgi:ribonuclease HI